MTSEDTADLSEPRRRARFDRAYSLVVLVKGIDGALELLAGLTIFVTPSFAEKVLRALATEVSEGSGTISTLTATYLGRMAAGLTSPSPAVVAFLVLHGVVKLATVYFLLRRMIRAYPWALTALIALAAVQAVAALTESSFGAWLLVGLDVVVVALVLVEYRRMRHGETARR